MTIVTGADAVVRSAEEDYEIHTYANKVVWTTDPKAGQVLYPRALSGALLFMVNLISRVFFYNHWILPTFSS
jgi:hypothetical protein